MRFRAPFLPAMLACVLFSGAAHAGPCDGHFTFDGNLVDTGGSGNDGQFIDSSGEPIDMSGEFVPGKIGQALRLNGETTVFSELDLQTETCPQVSVTAWIFLEGFPKNSHGLISTGFGRGPRLAASSSNLSSWGGNNEIRAGLAIRPGIWIFVAGVWDYSAGIHRLYWRHRSMEEALGENSRPPQEGFWIGAYAYGSQMMNRANGILIDDLKVHGKALTQDEVHAIRDAENDRKSPCDYCPPNGGSVGTVLATGPGGTSDAVTDILIERASENSPPDITYESEREGIAAAEAAEARREQERRASQADSDVPTSRSDSPLSGVGSDIDQVLRPTGLPTVPGVVAGYSGYNQHPFDLEDRFLTAIAWSEKRDHPCFIRIVASDNDVLGQEENKIMNLPLQDGCARDPKRVDIDQPRVLIKKLQVCNNNNANRRMKGLRIIGEQLSADGTATDITEVDTGERPHCATWSRPIQCPAGQYATGIVVHFNEGSGGISQIVGLQLICRRVAR